MITKIVNEDIEVLDIDNNITRTIHSTEIKLFGLTVYKYHYNLKSKILGAEITDRAIGFNKKK